MGSCQGLFAKCSGEETSTHKVKKDAVQEALSKNKEMNQAGFTGVYADEYHKPDIGEGGRHFEGPGDNTHHGQNAALIGGNAEHPFRVRRRGHFDPRQPRKPEATIIGVITHKQHA